MREDTRKTPVSLIVCIYILTCQVLIIQADPIPVYSLRLETCNRTRPETDSVLRVHLYNGDGSITRKFNLQGRGPSTPKKDVFYLNNTDTVDLGQICGIDLSLTGSGTKTWKLKNLSVRHWDLAEEAIFTENNCAENEISGNWLSYEREAPYWGPWGDCGCGTKLRHRTRTVVKCLNWTKSEEQPCQPSFRLCFVASSIIIIPNIMFGVNILILMVIVFIYANRRRHRSAAIYLKTLPERRGIYTTRGENKTPEYDYVTESGTLKTEPLPPGERPELPPPASEGLPPPAPLFWV